MVDRVELFEIADAIVAEGQIPSTRAVRQRLRRKGSYSDIGPILSEWHAERNFRPRPTADDLPGRLAGSLTSLAAEIWWDGHREGLIAAQNELGRVVAEREAARIALAEANAMVDNLERHVSRLEKGVPVEAAKLSRQRSANIAFWKSVMLEIVALLGTRGSGRRNARGSDLTGDGSRQSLVNCPVWVEWADMSDGEGVEHRTTSPGHNQLTLRLGNPRRLYARRFEKGGIGPREPCRTVVCNAAPRAWNTVLKVSGWPACPRLLQAPRRLRGLERVLDA